MAKQISNGMKNKTKNLIIYSIGIVFLVGIVALVMAGWNNDGDNTNSSPYSASALSAVESSFDFGALSMEDGDVFHEFEVKNEGVEPVNIEKVYTSCMCTTASITDSYGKKYGKFGMQGHGSSSKTSIEVGPGESVIVKAIFDPAAHGPSGVGLVQRSIYIETNSSRSPKFELSFQAMVTR